MDEAETQRSYETGGFRIDPVQRVLLGVHGTRVPLSTRAFDLLLLFVRRPGELIDKNRLMAAAWPNTVVEENNLTQAIGALRKALGEAPGEHRFLVTEPGRGYRFVAPVRIVDDSPAPSGPRKNRRFRVLTAALGVALILAALLLWPRAAPPPVDRSIAVLPFENRSDAHENAYLALGIQDEILTLLTRVGELRVVSRTSTLRYAGTTTGARQIGSELGVAYLLEGSVQRSGNDVRINVTLVDAAADRHLWAQSYERAAADVFAVESEVAQSVAAALQARLTQSERAHLTRAPSANPAAYDAYLRARASAERSTRTESEIRAAIDAYQEAVRLDPEFAIAWAQLSRRHANFFSLAYDRSDTRRRLAAAALQEAARLAPDLPETRAARAYYLLVVEGDLHGAENAFRELEARAPQNADAAAGLAQIAREFGKTDLARRYTRRVLELDPLNPYRHGLACLDYAVSGDFDLAVPTCTRALALLPGDAGVRAVLATIHQARGRLDSAREILRDLEPAPDDWRSLRALSRQSLLERQPRAAVALLGRYLEPADALGTRRGVVRRWLADAQRLAGDPAAARASYAQALVELEAEIGRQPANPALVAELAIVRSRLGMLEVATRLIPACLEFAGSPHRETYITDCKLAQLQVALGAGDPPRVIPLLKEAMELRGSLPPLTRELLRLDPDLDALRMRKDFQALL